MKNKKRPSRALKSHTGRLSERPVCQRSQKAVRDKNGCSPLWLSFSTGMELLGRSVFTVGLDTRRENRLCFSLFWCNCGGASRDFGMSTRRPFGVLLWPTRPDFYTPTQEKENAGMVKSRLPWLLSKLWLVALAISLSVKYLSRRLCPVLLGQRCGVKVNTGGNGDLWNLSRHLRGCKDCFFMVVRQFGWNLCFYNLRRKLEFSENIQILHFYFISFLHFLNVEFTL